MLTLLAAWCGLRFGELTELRRADVVVSGKDKDGTLAALIKVRRGVVRVEQAYVVGDPKSAAGVRKVAVPPHLVGVLRDHVAKLGPDDLLFPSLSDPTRHMGAEALYTAFHPARDAAGRPDLRFRDLRHTAGTLAAKTGATIAEIVERLGHSTPAAAMRYQHAANGRDAILANKLSAIAELAARETSR